jgi:hypothetical protein
MGLAIVNSVAISRCIATNFDLDLSPFQVTAQSTTKLSCVIEQSD